MESGAPPRPLSALLSQVLVAYTIEFDNEFERQTGTNLSLVVWSNLMRFCTPEGVSIRALADHSLAPVERLKTQLGCLERWGFVVLQPGKRDGWGSARGMKNDWIVRPSERGVRAINTWPSLFKWIESRWQTRFGNPTLRRLCDHLQTIANRIEYELPQALPATWLQGESEPYPPRTSKPQPLDLSTLLAQVLLQFRLEFDRESPTALALCAKPTCLYSPAPQSKCADPAGSWTLTSPSSPANYCACRHVESPPKPSIIASPPRSNNAGKRATATSSSAH
jgi:hypothetical protein